MKRTADSVIEVGRTAFHVVLHIMEFRVTYFKNICWALESA